MNEKMQIGYIETFPVPGLERWRKIPLSVEVTPDIDFLTATDEEIEAFMVKVRRVQYALKKQVQDFFWESKGHDEKVVSEKQSDSKASDTPQSTEAKSEEEIIIEAIKSMNSVKFLKIYEKHRGKSEATRQAYDEKLNELTNK